MANLTSIVKMSDRISVRRVLEHAAAAVLLVAATLGLVYAISVAATLQELRTLEPLTLDGHPDLEIWRCPAAIAAPASGPVADAESRTRSAGAALPPAGAERSASCAPGTRQARPQ